MAHIMVVDDDDEIRVTLCELLEEEGHRAVGACNGRDALEQLRSQPHPCVIFLDLMMPVIDGWEVLRQRGLDKALSRIPVVVITAAGEQAAADVRVDRVLQKPVRVERILDAVADFC